MLLKNIYGDFKEKTKQLKIVIVFEVEQDVYTNLKEQNQVYSFSGSVFNVGFLKKRSNEQPQMIRIPRQDLQNSG